MDEVTEHVARSAELARAAAPGLAAANDARLHAALGGVADRLESAGFELIATSRDEVAAAEGTLSPAVIDRLRLDEERLAGMVEQVRELAALPPAPRTGARVTLDGGLELEERRIPVGVIGANYEARVNVTLDISSQLIKSRNAGVLRTGAAALRTAALLMDRVVGPALEGAGLPADAIQLVRVPAREAAHALVSLPQLIPLVILRGSGPTTADLAATASRHGVRTLAHAEGGGVLYVDPSADLDLALHLIERSLDRLGVCNRLNLLLVHTGLWDSFVPRATAVLEELGVTPSMPPHDHPVGYEWANDDERSATVTVAPIEGARHAAELANDETSGLAASIVAADPGAAEEFLAAYRGTGGFWNATTRLLDGFRLFQAPVTGINIDPLPGPRGPVTYRDLYLRQFVVSPPNGAAGAPISSS
ncbi:MAG: glutamate-5-semialdehyde dehydrogenase [Thermoleophilaceae bacterium]|nr:glutamate-5-semialdehyde dehydrogenase [Thermoleophilaceae bacterium]